MESDREIIRQLGFVVEAAALNVSKQFIKTAILGSVAGYVTYKISKKIYVHYKVKKAAEKLKKNRERAELFIEQSIVRWKESIEYAGLLQLTQGVLVEDYITRLSFDKLVDALQTDELSAYSVLKSYQMKAIQQRRVCNSVVGWIEEADQMARELDERPVNERKPFHGVPISIKESFYVRNTYSTAGCIKFLSSKDSVTCPTVQTFINLGAVPFCKTNIPQGMYSMECTNPLYGATSNPHNISREAGGSSGGEASIIGGRGSILGLGGDIGGSLRGPAASCGIYSMKPTIGRHLSLLDSVASGGPCPMGSQPVGGFMSSSARCLQYAWRTVWNIEESDNAARFDGSIAPLRFNQDLFERKMKVGFFLSEGMFKAVVPGVQRTVLQAVQLLRDNSYDVVEFQPPDFTEMMYLFNGIILADTDTLKDNISWDVHSSALSGLNLALILLRIPRFIRRIFWDPIHRCLTSFPPLESSFATAKHLNLGHKRRTELQRMYLEKMNEAGVEVIICPGQLVPALPLGQAGLFANIVGPYIPWNMLNLPAGIAPINRYTEADAASMKDYPTNDVAYRMIHSYCKGAEGMPMGVQVVARPYREEQVLQILSVLEKYSKFA